MAYSSFTLASVQIAFDLLPEEHQPLFSGITEVRPSERLPTDITENKPLAIAINREKARSEFLIAPILAEVRRQTTSTTSTKSRRFWQFSCSRYDLKSR